MVATRVVNAFAFTAIRMAARSRVVGRRTARGTLACLLAASVLGPTRSAAAQEPDGLGRAALNDPRFAWTAPVSVSGLRVYFLPDTYPWQHRDSLVELTERGRRHGLGLLGADRFDPAIDLFFIESRAQMDSLVGVPVTGFAHRDARAVFLVTNPTWRSFERHELMHVLAHHLWGPAAEPDAWIVEGLAQFADGRCGGHSIHAVARAITESNGPIPLDELAVRFREFDDLSAYLQAASMVGWLYESYGRDTVRRIWSSGLDALPATVGMSAAELTNAWYDWLERSASVVPGEELRTIQTKGCG